MKTIRTGILLLILTLPFYAAYGQSEIYGRWNASCIFERNQNGSLTSSGLCPLSIKENNKLEINDFEFEISEQNIKIIINGKTTSVKYTLEGSVDAISFQYEKNLYIFKILRSTSVSNFILKDINCGGLLLLSKK